MSLVFKDPYDYDKIKLGARLTIKDAPSQIKNTVVKVEDIDTGDVYETETNFSNLEVEMILKGGKINMIKDD